MDRFSLNVRLLTAGLDVLQGFFSKRSGCVFKWAKKGSPAAAPWHILLREGEAAWQVGPAGMSYRGKYQSHLTDIQNGVPGPFWERPLGNCMTFTAELS